MKLAWFGSFRYLCQRYIYEVVPTYWLTLTLDPSPLRNKSIFSSTFYSSSIMYYIPLHPNKNVESSGTEQKMSSQEHPLIRLENDGYKNPQQIVSFKSHVAFYHIVSNEVLP